MVVNFTDFVKDNITINENLRPSPLQGYDLVSKQKIK